MSQAVSHWPLNRWDVVSFPHNSISDMFFFFSKYRVIRKSFRDFRPLRYSSWDGHAEGEHVNRGRGTPVFCPNLQVLDMSTLGDAAEVNPVIKFQSHTCNVCGRNLDYLSFCWHAPLRRDHPGYCTAQVGNPGRTSKLPCNSIFPVSSLPWVRLSINSTITQCYKIFAIDNLIK